MINHILPIKNPSETGKNTLSSHILQCNNLLISCNALFAFTGPFVVVTAIIKEFLKAAVQITLTALLYFAADL